MMKTSFHIPFSLHSVLLLPIMTKTVSIDVMKMRENVNGKHEREG
jgi:hypothetical protein